MIDIFDSNGANRAINTFIDFAGTDKILNKELLVLTLIAYKGTTTVPYLKRIIGTGVEREVVSLLEKGYIGLAGSEGRTKYYKVNYKPVSSEVFAESVMYVFCNALFNIHKYIKDYKITSWNNLASIVELPLHSVNNGKIHYAPEDVKVIGGSKQNKLFNRSKLVKFGVIKESRSEGKDIYNLNKLAYLMGAC